MNYDVIVIGGGTAGLAAYRKAKSLGKTALIIESKDFVTTCADVGCMPSKLLIAAADNMAELNHSSKFGIEIENIQINEKVLWNRVRSERDRFVSFVKAGAEKIPAEDKIIGYAKIKDINTVEVNDKLYATKSIVIATGSRPFVPGILDNFKNEILTNENVFELNHIPKSIAIFGAGVIGLELGFAFKNLGSEITLFNKSDKLINLNKELNQCLKNHIQENMNFIYEESVEGIIKLNGGYLISYGNKTKWVEKILVTAGRRPNIDNLGLENIEQLKDKNVLSGYNALTTQLFDLPIFLAGDVNNEVTLLHEAANEGNIAGVNAAHYPHVTEQKRNVFMGIVFSNPQIMQVGKMDESENSIVGKVSFEDQGRSRVMLKNKGLLQLYFDRGNHVLKGAEMIGPAAEHIAHMLAWIIEKEITLEEMLELPYYHPVVEEGIRTAVRDAYSKI